MAKQKHKREIWRNIPGLPSWAYVSNRGRVRTKGHWIECICKGKVQQRFFKGRIYKLGVDSAGYHQVRINGKMWSVAHLVLMASGKPRPSPLHESDHVNWNTTDNRPSNLRWLTRTENSRHRKRPVLNPELVAHIRHLDNEWHTIQAIADHLDLSRHNVWHVTKGHSWKNIKHQDFSEEFGEIN